MPFKWLFFIIILCFFTSNCSQGQTQNMTSDQGTKPAVSVAKVDEKKLADTVAQNEPIKTKGSLLFFLNPHGYPCQMQDKILVDNQSKIEKYVNIVYVSTDNRGDRPTFYKYGIRALPAIIFLNNKGELAQRFPPGIKNLKELLEALQNL